jgi:SAM-dependent methyltransferase
MATALRERFLTEVFRVEHPDYLFDIVDQSVRECDWQYGADAKDSDVYLMVQRYLREKSWSRPLSTIRRGYWAWRQVVRQRREWVSEASHLIHQLRGPRPSLQGYLSIGDPGRTVTALANKLSVRGQRFVAHNQHGNGLVEKIERNSLSEVGKFVLWDPTYDGHLQMEDASVDLVTLFTGLHHVPPHQLTLVLNEIYRVLRPGGIFLIREHDGTPELVPMLEVAHSLFNAVMGSPVEDDIYELRHFRTVDEWRHLISGQTGFIDAMLFSVQDFDPTVDVMMTFVKAPLQPDPQVVPQMASIIQDPTKKTADVSDPMSSGYAVPEWEVVDIAKRFSHSLDVTPWFRFPFLRSLSDEWRLLWVSFRQASDRFGMASALSSSGLGIGIFMCVVYTIVAVQAALVAIPCRLMYGDEDPDTNEQIVVVSRIGLGEWIGGGEVGHSSARLVLEEEDGTAGTLSFVEMNPHLPLTKVLSSIAAYSDDAELASVDGLDARHRITVMMSANADVISNGGEAALERSVGGLTVLLVRRPHMHPVEIQAIIEVPIGLLLTLFRRWPGKGHDGGWHIRQVYGFIK